MEELININEFIEKHCQDIVKDSKVIDSLRDEDFSFDLIKDDPETGKPIKYVVDSTGIEIPIFDILEMERLDFQNYYKTKEAMELYDQYLYNFNIDYGEDVLLSLRNSLVKQNERIKKFKKISEGLDCGF